MVLVVSLRLVSTKLIKNEALDIIQENPYQLVEDIEGIGFKRADNLAEQLGIAADSPKTYPSSNLTPNFSACGSNWRYICSC